MAQYQRRMLREMILKTVKLHYAIHQPQIKNLDEAMFQAFMNDWFSKEVKQNLVPLVLETSQFPIGIMSMGILSSIFQDIDVHGKLGNPNFIVPNVMSVLEYQEKDSKNYQQRLKTHIQAMQSITKSMKWDSLLSFYTQYHAVFKAYTSLIGAFTKETHTTVDAYTQYKLDVLFEDDTKELYIIDFDLSGMQPFIYEVTEGGEAKRDVAKAVRGRSFYLNLMTDFTGFAFLNVFDLPYEYFLMSAGGKGTVAIPKDEDAFAKVQKVQNQIEEVLFYLHQTKLSIAFNTRSINKHHLIGEASYRIIDVDQGLSTSKKSKFKSLLKNLDQNAISAVQKRCELCGAPVHSKEARCETCIAAIEISKMLASHTTLNIIYDFSKERIGEVSIPIGDLGMIHIGAKDTTSFESDQYMVSINHHHYGDIRYYANVFAKGKSFQEMSVTNSGDEKLAVLKMDVDNLGLLFLKGLKLKEQSYYKYLVLSKQLDYFFTYQLAEICRDDIYDDQVYISYSGGDDLVIICPANMSLKLLKHIYDAFSNFVCQHPHIHLSAGIEIFHPKSPFRHAVKFADGQLDKAKNTSEKNHFSVLGYTIANQDLGFIIEETDHYLGCVHHDIISKNIIQRLYQAISESLSQPNPSSQFYPYIPLISYMLERNIQGRNEAEKIRLKNLFVTTQIKDEALIKYLVVFGYVLLGSRIKNHKEV